MEQGKSKVGFLSLYFDLYLGRGDAGLRTQEVYAKQLVECLEQSNEVVFPGVCTNRTQVDEAVRVFDREEVDVIVVVFLCYVPSLYIMPALKRTPRPVVIWNTQKLWAVTQELKPHDTSENHGMHGVQDLANVLKRAGRPFHIVTGFWKDEAVVAEVQAWCDAARVVREMRQARVGLVGHAMESMGDFGLDESSFLAQVGVHVHHLPMRVVADEAAAAPQAEIDALMAYDRETFQMDPKITPEQHETNSRLEWAFRKLLKDRQLMGFAAHFLSVGNEQILDTLPFLAACKLLGEGYGYGGEGDVTSAVATWMLNRLVGEATFTEMFTMDFGGGTTLMSHMGEGNWRMAHPSYPVVLRSSPFGMTPLRVPPTSLGFSYRPGPVTLVSLTTVENGRLTFIITEGEVLDNPPIPAVSRVHCRFKPHRMGPLCDGGSGGQGPHMPLPEFLTRFSEAGGSHHQGMAYGHVASKVVKVAKLLGADYTII